MARVVALVPDLMFGSRVQSMLEAAGHEVTLTGAEDEARTEAEFADALVVDLTTDTVDGVMLVDSMRAGAGGGVRRGGTALADGARGGGPRGTATGLSRRPRARAAIRAGSRAPWRAWPGPV